MPDNNRVALAIQRARQLKRLTQQELADLLGVPQPTVARWETGQHFPRKYARAIEEVLEVTLPGNGGEPS